MRDELARRRARRYGISQDAFNMNLWHESGCAGAWSAAWRECDFPHPDDFDWTHTFASNAAQAAIAERADL